MAANPISVGAALTFTENDSGFFTTSTNTSVLIGTGVTTVLNNNADRLELIFFNNSAVDVVLWTDSSVSTTLGFRCVATGGFLVFKVRDDFTLLSNNWFGISTGAAVTIAITEVSRITFPPGGKP
jgi:hypothetical protein